MATVAATTQKINRTYRAHLCDEPGALTQVHGVIYFLADTGEITVIEPADCPFLTVLGEIGVADTQQMCDRLSGGGARIACDRQMEVQ
jgi:hypothetical protein